MHRALQWCEYVLFIYSQCPGLVGRGLELYCILLECHCHIMFVSPSLLFYFMGGRGKKRSCEKQQTTKIDPKQKQKP